MGVFLVWYQLNKMTVTERSDMWDAIKTVDPIWIIISLLFGLFSHFSRAYRWKFLLEPLGYKPRFRSSFMAILIGYFANTFIIRSGEVLRGVSLSRTDNIPFEKAFGTIVAERIADLIVLLLVMATAIALQSTALVSYFRDNANPIGFIILLIVGSATGIIGLRLLKTSSHSFIKKIRDFGLGLLRASRAYLR